MPFFIFFKQFVAHDHEAEDTVITAQKIFKEATAVLRQDPTRPIKRTFNEY